MSKETLSLPKDKGGLYFRTMQSIFNSLKAKWVVRLLDPSNHEWKALAALSHGLLATSTLNMDKVSLACTAPVVLTNSTKPSPFWSEANLPFWKLKSTLSLIGDVPGMFARCMPLLNNFVIQLNGGPLKGNKWKSLVSFK